MERLIEQLYNSREIPLIKSLLEESENSIKQAVGHKLLISERITLNQPLNQLCLITCTAPFAQDDNECFAVGVAIYSLLRVNDVLPLLSKHKYAAFSNRTLISLSFFPEAMQRRFERFSAPSPSFYKETAKNYYKNDKLESLAENMEKWIDWIQIKLF